MKLNLSRRRAQPPKYRVVAPGLVITDDSAWAVYEIGIANTDQLPEAERDAQQDRVEKLIRSLAGRDCQLRSAWGAMTGAEYLAGLDLQDSDPDGMHRWAQLRADSIDELQLPVQRVFLEVKLVDRQMDRSRAAATMGLSRTAVSEDEIAALAAQVIQLARRLRQPVFRLRLAAADVIAWLLARETGRNQVMPGTGPIIQGAELARLTSGFIDPLPDHVCIRDKDDEVIEYARTLTLTTMPETLTTPGGEWLAVLNGLMTDGLEGASTDVLAEYRVRFTPMRQSAAATKVNKVRKAAKEQERAASQGLAGEPPELVSETRDDAEDVLGNLKRGRIGLVECQPRIVVTAPDLHQLEARTDAVINAYEALQIVAYPLVNEQRESWLECQLAGQVRIPDMGHLMDATAFAAAWWWGGAVGGSTDPRVPVIGYTSGPVPRVYRYLANEAVDSSDAPVTALLGRTRRGKTTAIMMCLLDVQLSPLNRDRDPWSALIDLKGDAGGAAVVAEEFGVPVESVVVGENDAGIFDPLAGAISGHEVEHCVAQLLLLLPGGDAAQAAGLIEQATSAVWHDPEPAAWKVIEKLEAMVQEQRDAGYDATTTAYVAATLQAATAQGWGRMIAGRPAGTARRIPTTSGLTLIQIPHLYDAMPTERDSRTWTPQHRRSMAVLRGVLQWVVASTAAMQHRARAKVVAVPEVHLLLATDDGAAFLDQLARMGAAFSETLLLDTQDSSSLAQAGALTEGIATVFGFAQRSTREQDSLATLVGLEPDEQTRATIGDLDRGFLSDEDPTSEQAIRRGHSLAMDRYGEVVTLQWVTPSAHVQQMLDTSAAATHRRAYSPNLTKEHADSVDDGIQQDVEDHAPASPRSAWDDGWLPDILDDWEDDREGQLL